MLKQDSYARVTLALDIIRKLDKGEFKGYHELNVIKHQINLHDAISIKESDIMQIICNDPQVPADSSNLCWKAAELMQREFNINDNVRIDITKSIPLGGGLAGGSANAATTLSILNRLWNLHLSTDELIGIGRRIGMDVPSFFSGNTAFDTETTNTLDEIKTDMSLNFVLVFPDFGVSTKEAYQNIDYSGIAKNVSLTNNMKSALEEGDFRNVVTNLHNDFEFSVFKNFPSLKNIKEELMQSGCLGAVMSGSGSTLFGITESRKDSINIKNQLNHEVLIAASK